MIELILAQFLTYQDPSPRRYTDGTDLGRAMDICARYEIPSNQVYLNYPTGSPVPGGFPRTWESCYKVRDLWWRSEAGKRESVRRNVFGKRKKTRRLLINSGISHDPFQDASHRRHDLARAGPGVLG